MNRCIFNKTWLRDDNLEWLEEVPNDKYMFRCRVCSKNLELGRMGKAVLSRHLKSKKHSDLINSTSNSPSFIKLWTSGAKKTMPTLRVLSRVLPQKATSFSMFLKNLRVRWWSWSKSQCTRRDFDHDHHRTL